MPPEDRVRVLHMLEAAEQALGFMAGFTSHQLGQDKKTLFAVIRCIEVIGEAAGRVSESTRLNAQDIPWAAITGMRNRLVHAYFDVDTAVVWRTVAEELPTLLQRLRPLVAKG
jgi:uncharacterized protein with HEPN domain